MRRLASIGAARLAAILLASSACASQAPTGTVNGPGPAGTPELPRTYLDTHYVPSSGKSILVQQGGDLQAALNTAQPCDVILLQAGATFTGTYTLPAKSGSCWITIRSSAPDSSLPPEGTRITPSFSGALPKIVTPNSAPALRAATGAHHYRLLGVEITVASGVSLNYGVVTLGDGIETSLSQLPNNIILDRVYVHGNSTVNVSRCVALNSAATAVVDSYLSECHASGFDSQAICGWNGPGPFKIVNDYLEGAGETVLFGGSDPKIANLTPSDIEIRHNHITRPLSWKGVWTVKNLFELKNAQRLLVEGNVFENHWADAQDGFAFVWKSVNQNGTAPWSVTRDVTFQYNRLRKAGGGVNIASNPESSPAQPLSRILIANNVFDSINVGAFNGHGRLYQILQGPAGVTIEHNTTINSDSSNAAVMMDVAPPRAQGFVFRDNITTSGQYGVFGSNVGIGTAALNYYMAPGFIFRRNVVVGADSASYPADNFFPANIAAIAFVDVANGNYRLASSSRYARMATDGKDVGADIDALEQATAGAVLP